MVRRMIRDAMRRRRVTLRDVTRSTFVHRAAFSRENGQEGEMKLQLTVQKITSKLSFLVALPAPRTKTRIQHGHGLITGLPHEK